MAPEQFRFRVYYDGTSAQTGTEWLNTSTMNSSYYLDDDGSKDITDYINTVKLADGKKGTTTGGSVEWCVIYDYDNNQNFKKSYEFLNSLKHKNISRIYPKDIYCSKFANKKCVTHNGKEIFYVDDEHLSVNGSKNLNKSIVPEIEKILKNRKSSL